MTRLALPFRDQLAKPRADFAEPVTPQIWGTLIASMSRNTEYAPACKCLDAMKCVTEDAATQAYGPHVDPRARAPLPLGLAVKPLGLDVIALQASFAVAICRTDDGGIEIDRSEARPE